MGVWEKGKIKCVPTERIQRLHSGVGIICHRTASIVHLRRLMLINTLKAKKQLVEEYGFDERQAEGVVEIVGQANEQVATKEDITLLQKDVEQVRQELKADVAQVRLEIEQVRQELKADIAQVRQEIEQVRQELKADVAQVRQEIEQVRQEVQAVIWRVVAIGVGIILAALAVCTTIIVSYG